ncbi:putative fluoride ion transporter CrcB [Methanimicrococcus sp. At1]|uniref:Fluoride-specific ion channel n=1 Tax=Methanimicrococcus hacksteinii TaxID=3028293 RepID=A0ABU3VQV2_9EURY|nr:CrcB family protein [Methanimicrococcus sp. At1]MDV0445778.1 putative fluoride ion transporter CrcB [Methanimicrococcus sp. At1]
MAESRGNQVKQTGLQNTKPPMFDFMTRSAVFSVMLGGFFGSLTRAVTFLLIQTAGADIVVNIIGSFLIGFFMFLPSVRDEKIESAGKTGFNKKQFISTGFLGGFTTFSYFIFGPFLSAAANGAESAVNVFANITPLFMIQFLIYAVAFSIIGIIAAAIGKYFAEFSSQKKKKGNVRESNGSLKETD